MPDPALCIFQESQLIWHKVEESGPQLFTTVLYKLFLKKNQQAKKGVTVLAGVTDPDYQGEFGLPLHNGGKEE